MCIEFGDLVASFGPQPFDTYTIVDGDESTCLDPLMTSPDHIIRFTLPVQADKVMLL